MVVRSLAEPWLLLHKSQPSVSVVAVVGSIALHARFPFPVQAFVRARTLADLILSAHLSQRTLLHFLRLCKPGSCATRLTLSASQQKPLWLTGRPRLE